MAWTEKQEKEYQKRIAHMEKYIKAFNWESCSKIIAYLKIYGKMKASELNKKVGLVGEKSIYRSLKILIEAGIIEKEYEANALRNAYYYHTGELIRDPDFDEGFIHYLIEKGKYNLISEYLRSANKGSTGMITAISEIIKELVEETEDPAIGEKFIDNTIFLEILFSHSAPEKIKKEIMTFVKEKIKPLVPQESLPKKKRMKNPIMFYLAYVPLIKAKNMRTSD